MATWIVHLRVADHFLENCPYPYEFVVGNVAPDCGYGQKDSFGEFDPPPTVTHWTDTGSKRDCRYKDFYNEYLKDKKHDRAYFFYLGYYVHLLTDIMWSTTICIPTYSEYADEYEKDPEFLRVIKRDWNDLDFKYLQNNPEFETYKIIKEENGEITDFLPYYEHNQLTNQVRFIADYYKKELGKHEVDREYEYLTEDKLEDFMSAATEMIEKQLSKQNLI